MPWQDDLVARLEAQPVCGYADEATPAAEPTALTALALTAFGKTDAALVGADLLREMQAKDGSVGVRPGDPTPAWPTSLAALAWSAIDRDAKFKPAIDAAVAWILDAKGKTVENDGTYGHDTQLVGWSWAADTHSWIEPTIFCTLALKAAGQNKHPRTREAIALLMDRQLPGGGCNYGNTFVLGQPLRPHLLPSGMLLIALEGENDPSGRAAKSVNYVANAIANETTPSTLAWALLGLAAAGRKFDGADKLLEQADADVVARGASPHKSALLAHALLADRSPLIALPRKGSRS